MARTSDMDRIGDTVKTQFGEAVDHVTTAASEATDALRERSSRLVGSAQELYEEFDSEAVAAKLRGAVSDYPLVALLVAAGAGYLLARMLHD
jgi:hypothetical protein